jgi:hypothetical protein
LLYPSDRSELSLNPELAGVVCSNATAPLGGHQSEDEITNAAPRLHPREPASDPAHQLLEVHPPVLRVYAMAHGHGKII